MSAYIAAAVKAKVTLIEKPQMGGDCLNTGCVPSKALIRSAKMAQQLKKAHAGYRHAAEAELISPTSWSACKGHRDIEPHDSVGALRGLGVEVLQGEARITSPGRWK